MANKMNTELGLDLTPFEKSLVRLQKRLGELSRNLEGIGQSMTQNLTLPILGIGAAAVKSFADFDKLERGLTAVMGTSEAAAAELEKLKEAARAPGLGFEEAVRGSIRLQAVGLSADEARGTLQAFGAAIAATGGTAENLESVQYQLTQMISKNRILQEDFGILQENVPLLGKAVQQAFGTANIEQIRATGISAQDFNKRLVEALQSLPEVQKATGGLGNAFDNFTDSLKFSLGELGRIIAETINLEGILNGLSDALAAVVGWFKQLNPGAQKFVVVLGLILAGIGPVLFVAAKLVGLFSTLSAGFRVIIGLGPKLGAAFTAATGPIGLTVLAILGAIAAVAALYNKFEGVRRVVNGVGQSFIEFAKLAKNSFSALIEGFALLKEGEFKKAATQFGKSLQVLDPISQGRAFAVGFAKGFEDTTNYLEPTVKKIKEQVQGAQKALGLVGDTSAPFDLTSQEKPKKQKNVKRETFDIALLSREEITLTKNELEKYAETIKKAQTDSALATQQTNDRFKDTRDILSQVGLAANSTRDYFEKMDVAALAAVEEKLKRAKEALDNFNTSAQQIVEGALEGLAVGFGEFLGKIADAPLTLRGLIGTILIPIADALINLGKLAVATGIAVEGIKKALQTLNPIAAIVGGVALIALGSFVKSKAANLTKLAKGGLAFGPTTAIVGDNPAARTDPEVIAPLSKLKDYLNPGGGAMIAEARISGNDLLILVNNAERANNRIR
jgi:tape measure domain-containing protein